MTELLFFVLIIFVGYVIYAMIIEARANAKTSNSVVIETPQNIPSDVKTKMVEHEITDAKQITEPQKQALKNPKTGEIATQYQRYQFAKRWIKEALVEEGLLEKIYKANELTPAIEEKIKAALTQLESNEKYRV